MNGRCSGAGFQPVSTGILPAIPADTNYGNTLVSGSELGQAQPFSLTPALSRWEREPPSPSWLTGAAIG